MRRIVRLAVVLSVLACGQGAQAGPIIVLVGTELDSGGNIPGVLRNQFLAQPFSLNRDSPVGEIQVFVANISDSPVDGAGLEFTLQLTDAVGPGTTSASLLAESTFTFPGAAFTDGFIFSMPVARTLQAGTYYLVASTTTGSASSDPRPRELLGWPRATSIFGSPKGSASGWIFCSSNCSIDSAFPPATEFTGSNAGALEFQVCEGQCPDVRVTIDIIPRKDPNIIKLFSHSVSVAILTTETFDAATVDPASVVLACASVRMRGNGRTDSQLKDVDKDGDMDLIVKVFTEQMAITPADTVAVLTGTTFSGMMIQGTDTIQVVP